jgi:hypothetical protein
MVFCWFCLIGVCTFIATFFTTAITVSRLITASGYFINPYKGGRKVKFETSLFAVSAKKLVKIIIYASFYESIYIILTKT